MSENGHSKVSRESHMYRIIVPGLWALTILGFAFSQYQYKRDVREAYSEVAATYRDAFVTVRAEKLALQNELQKLKASEGSSNSASLPPRPSPALENSANTPKLETAQSELAQHQSDTTPRLDWFREALQDLNEPDREIALGQLQQMDQFRQSLSDQEQAILDSGVEQFLKEALDGIEAELVTSTPEQEAEVRRRLSDPKVQDLLAKVAELSALSLMEAEEAILSAKDSERTRTE